MMMKKMKTKKEIVNDLANNKFIENILFKNRLVSPYVEDLAQDLYISLLDKDEQFIIDLYNKKQLEFYIRRMITNNIFSKTSQYYMKYQKFRKKSDELKYDTD